MPVCRWAASAPARGSWLSRCWSESRSASCCRPFLSIKAGLRAPGGLTTAHTVVVGVAAGIGFTVALFFATAAFPPGPVLDEVKMGSLLSFLAAPCAILLGRAVGLRPSGSRIADR